MTTPISMSDVSSEWLSTVLGSDVTLLCSEPVGAGVGFLGQLARVHISSGHLPETLIVKLPTTDPGGHMMGEMMGVWEREHRFYTEVAPRVTGMRIPQCFYSTAQPYALILEDMAPAQSGDQVLGPTAQQARDAVDAAARLHSAWFNTPEVLELTWMPDISDPMTATVGEMFAIGWPIFLERYESTLPSRVLRWCEEFAPRITQWIGSYSTWPVTLCHGDYRLDNMFFGADGTFGLIDWQMAMRAPSTTDLVYFIGTNLPTDMRREMQDELIQRYVDGLLNGGVPSEWANADKIVRGLTEGVLFYCTSFGASILTFDPANERGAALMDSLVRRAFSAADDLSAGHVFGFA